MDTQSIPVSVDICNFHKTLYNILPMLFISVNWSLYICNVWNAANKPNTLLVLKKFFSSSCRTGRPGLEVNEDPCMFKAIKPDFV